MSDAPTPAYADLGPYSDLVDAARRSGPLFLPEPVTLG
jgi:hypothetical protein